MMDYDIQFVKALLLAAGKRAMQHYRHVKPTWKENMTYLTQADLDVQEYLREELERRFPDDGIIAEEQNLARPPRAGDRYWVIDPIDGTASFVMGFPVWGIAVGLLTPSQALGGFFYLPATEDFYYTTPDGLVWRNEQPTRLKPVAPSCREAVLLAGARFHQSYTVSSAYIGKIRSLGSTISHLCYVATGGADAAFVEEVAVWDLAAGLAMLSHNDAVVEYWDGTPVSLEQLLLTRKAAQPLLAGHSEAVKQYRTWLTYRQT